MTPREAKFAALLSMPMPNSKKQSQFFIGLANYFSRYIPKFADITSNLTCLLQKNKKFIWSADAKNSYNKIKECLTKSPVLFIADFTKPFFIFVDASNIVVGSALCQLDSEGIYHPICYTSHKLNNAEQNYNITDREALGLVVAVRIYKVYLPSEYIVFSDHEPLNFFNKMASKNARIMRWSLKHAAYNITVIHIKESCNF